jgi:hypothetical protein
LSKSALSPKAPPPGFKDKLSLVLVLFLFLLADSRSVLDWKFEVEPE